MALVIVRSVVNTDAYPLVLLTVLFTHFALTFCPRWCHTQQYLFPKCCIITFGFPCTYFAYCSMDYSHIFCPAVMLSSPSLIHIRKTRIFQAAAVSFCDGRTVPKYH